LAYLEKSHNKKSSRNVLRAGILSITLRFKKILWFYGKNMIGLNRTTLKQKLNDC